MGLELWSLACDKTADNLGDLEYLEYRTTGQESYSTNNSEAHRVFITRWDRRLAFLDDCLGYSTIDSSFIARVLPDEHPQVTNFYADSATVDGFGILTNSDDAASWTCAKIAVTYRPLPYVVAEDDDDETNELYRYVTRNWQFSSNMLTLQGQIKFVFDNSIVQFPPNLITGDISLQYIWHWVPSASGPVAPPILANYASCIGKVNSTAFDTGGINAPATTILFTGIDPKMVCPKIGNSDLFYWEITYNFLYRNNGTTLTSTVAGHNALWHPIPSSGPAGWDEVTPQLYKQAELNNLFLIS